MRYHISPKTGNPNQCRAEKACPFGGEDAHYASKDEARAAFEAGQGSGVGPVAKKLTPKKMEKLAAQYDATSAVYPDEPTVEHLTIASAYAQHKNSFAVGAFRSFVSSKPMDLWMDYDNTGTASTVAASRDYIIACPNGGFVALKYQAVVHADGNQGSWEFDPHLNGYYNYYDSAEEAVANFRKTNEETVAVDFDTDSVFRQNVYGGSQLSYSHWDEDSTRLKAQESMKLADPYGLARAARLAKSKEKFKPDLLTNEKYLGSPNAHVRAAVAARPELPRSAQETLVNDASAEVRAALASRPDLAAATVKTLLSQDPKQDWAAVEAARYALLRNPALTETVARRVARDGTVEDLRALARNASLSKETEAIIRKRTESLGIFIFRN